MSSRPWVGRFLSRHIARFAPHDWPEGGEEKRIYLDAWVMAFDAKSIDEHEAEEASRQLVAAPPKYRQDHIPMVLAQVNAGRLATGGGRQIPESREEAEAQSRDCPECGGCGQTWRRFEGEDGQLYRFAFGCGCPFGRWLLDRRRADEKAPREVKGMPSLLDYPELIDPDRWPVGCLRTPPRGVLPAIRRGGKAVAMRRWLRDGEPCPSPAGDATPGPRKNLGIPQGPDVTERDWDRRRLPSPTGTDGPAF